MVEVSFEGLIFFEGLQSVFQVFKRTHTHCILFNFYMQCIL